MTQTAEQSGIACRKCGCQHLPVIYTRRRGNAIVRRRVCRYCGHKMLTRETLQ